jgi:four helix bundle protein
MLKFSESENPKVAEKGKLTQNEVNMAGKPPDLKLRTKEFALRVIRMYTDLPKSNSVAQVLGKQVLRSGTSVGANYREASRGRSKPEFISKIGDSLKEIDETEYWLELLVESGCVEAGRMAGLLDETRQLTAIFTAIDKKAKTRVK